MVVVEPESELKIFLLKTKGNPAALGCGIGGLGVDVLGLVWPPSLVSSAIEVALLLLYVEVLDCVRWASESRMDWSSSETESLSEVCRY
jgi:hypothetical protein